jgi:serine/threonine-protein kinase RsbW
MSHECWAWLLDQVIASERGAGHGIINEVLAGLKEHDWSQHDIFSIRLALEEALINAIKHGNRLDSNKQVHVVCKMSAEKLWIKIADEGPGFNLDEVPDPTDLENLDRPSGRGIMLMRSFMTRVEYNNAGNVVVMEKLRADARRADAN